MIQSPLLDRATAFAMVLRCPPRPHGDVLPLQTFRMRGRWRANEGVVRPTRRAATGRRTRAVVRVMSGAVSRLPRTCQLPYFTDETCQYADSIVARRSPIARPATR